MRTKPKLRGLQAAGLLGFAVLAAAGTARTAPAGDFSPDALVAAGDGRTIFVGCASSNVVLQVDVQHHQVRPFIATPLPVSGLALSSDNRWLYVACAAPASQVLVVHIPRHQIAASITTGYGSRAPVAARDGGTLYVCNQFENDISVIDLATRCESRRIPVQREPVAADITRDGKYLLVANQLSAGRADSEDVDADVSVIDLRANRVVKNLELPDGSECLKDLRVSPDGRYAALTHVRSNFDSPPRQFEEGQVNANALTLVDLNRIEILTTFYLDAPDAGAANAWGVAWSPEATRLAVTHAGTHEISLIDVPALLAGLPRDAKQKRHTDPSTAVLRFAPHYENDEIGVGLPFLVGARQRLKLPVGDLGPRAVVFAGQRLCTANYFSDNLSCFDLAASLPNATSIPLGPPETSVSAARRGELYFNDASLCDQGWESCASCHPDGRSDALDWQLRRNHARKTKSLLPAGRTTPDEAPESAHQALPADLDDAIRTSMRQQMNGDPRADIVADLKAYIQSLRPLPSPHLSGNALSPAASRGRALFTQTGCAACHPPESFTDHQWHDVGTGSRFDDSPRFPTLSLVEAWRNAPYLHDGSAATVLEVLTRATPSGARHGDVSKLNRAQLDDLCAYVLSL